MEPKNNLEQHAARRRNRPTNTRTGVTAVEFALVFPILMLLVFGSYELCRANMVMQTSEAAAYEATRVAIIPGASVAEAEAAARKILGTAGVRQAQITITPPNLDIESDAVNVSISINFTDNFILAPLFMGREPFVRRCELLREGL